MQIDITYYALDLDRQELVRSLQDLTSTYTYVKVAGLLGTYDDGIELMKRLTMPKSILWLGSSIANMDREDSAAILQKFPMNPGDTWVIGIDRRKDALKVWRAYNDSQGVTREFELNGLRNANKILGSEEFKEGEWEYIGEYDAVNGRHEAWCVPLNDVEVCGIHFKKGDKILLERSYKYGKHEVEELWEKSRVVEVGRWSDPQKDYGKPRRRRCNCRRTRCSSPAILLPFDKGGSPDPFSRRMEGIVESLGYGDLGDDPRGFVRGETDPPPPSLHFLYW